MDPACELLSHLWELIRITDKNGWTHIQFVSCSPMFKLIGTTDENGWKLIQGVSHLSVLELIRTNDGNGWTPIQHVSCSPVLVRTTDQKGKHPSREWVTIKCLSKSEPLTRMGEHSSSLWVSLQRLRSDSEPLMRMVNTQGVSSYSVLEGSQSLMRMGEHISSKWVVFSIWANQTTDKNGWTHIQRVSCSSLAVFEWINRWWEWVVIQLVSCIWVD